MVRPYRANMRAKMALGSLLALGMAGKPAAAQTPEQRLLGSFLSTGVYFPTAGSGRAALGDAKFYGELHFHTRPRTLSENLTITGGLDIVGASDHFFPFSGGSQFNLIGPGFRIGTPRGKSRIQPYFSGGLYVGQLRSERLNFDRTQFTPGIAVGVDFKVARYVSLSATYRVSQNINGYNTDGFGLSLRIF